MTNEENNSGVDISELTKAVEGSSDAGGTEDTLSEDELLGILNEQDPILGMISARIFDIGNVVADLVGRVDVIERHLGFLLSKDEDVIANMKKAAAAAEEAEKVEVGQPGESKR